MKNRYSATIILMILTLALVIFFYIPCAIGEGDRAKAESYIQEAYRKIEQHDVPGAIDALEKAKKADSTNAPVYYVLGGIYFSNYNYERAEKEYLIGVKYEKDYPADLYKALGDTYTAWAEMIEGKNGDQKRVKALREKAVKALKKGSEFNFQKNSDVQKLELYKQLARNYNALNDFTNGPPVIKKAADSYPTDAELRYQLGIAYAGKQKKKEAMAEFRKAKELVRGNPALLASIHNGIDGLDKRDSKKVMLFIKIGGVAAAIIILIIVLVMALKSRSTGHPDRDMETMRVSRRDSDRKDAFDASDDLNTPEGICKMVIRKLNHLIQMPKGVVYLPNEEGTLLIPKLHFGFDKDLDDLEVSTIDAREWIIERGGAPFVFKIERREVPFNRAFPDSSDMLGQFEMRIGIPLVGQNTFLGIVYFGCKESKNKLKFKKIFETNLPLISKVAEEASEVLAELIIRKQAITDNATGLYSDVYFREKLPSMIDEARKEGKTCSIILLSVDGYKEMMATFGEDHGEKLLKMSADTLKKVLADSDAILCRIEEVKFGIIAPQTPLDKATELAESLKEEISSVKVARHIPAATASIGVATFPATAIYAEKLLELVAEAMERAQNEGGNNIQIAEKKLRTMETTRMTRDQVLAAVERRRQARKTMRIGAEDEDSPDRDEILAPHESERVTPTAMPPQSSPEAPKTAPWKQPAQAIEKHAEPPAPPRGTARPQPSSAREEREPAPEPRPLVSTGGAGRNPLIPEPQEAPFSLQSQQQKQKSAPISPFSRRTTSSGSQEREDTPQALPFDRIGQTRQADMAPEGGAREQYEGLSMEDMAAIPRPTLIQGPDGKPPQAPRPGIPPVGISPPQRVSQAQSRSPFQRAEQTVTPAGPLNFSREMKTLDEREKQGRPLPGSVARPVQGMGIQGDQAARPPLNQPQAMNQPRPPAPPPPQAPPPAPPGYDPLTGFFQRAAFEQVLLSEAQKLSKTPGECALLYFGIDSFEGVKSQYGPAMARKLLKEVADVIKSALCEGKEIPARIEENGFALFLPGASLEGGMKLAAKLQNLVAKLPVFDAGLTASISIGISSYPQTVKSFREIILSSRRAMEKAMKSGGKRVEAGGV